MTETRHGADAQAGVPRAGNLHRTEGGSAARQTQQPVRVIEAGPSGINGKAALKKETTHAELQAFERRIKRRELTMQCRLTGVPVDFDAHIDGRKVRAWA